MARAGTNHKGGRPPGSKASHTLETQEARKKAIAMVDAKLAEIFAPQIAKAMEGDTTAFKAVLDRAWGTPPQYMELTGENGEKLFEPNEKLLEIANALLNQQKGNS